MKFLKYLFYLPLTYCINPFEPISSIYINPVFRDNIEKTEVLILNNINGYYDISHEEILVANSNMKLIKNLPSAFWIDKKSAIPTVKKLLDDMLELDYSTIVLIVYDLPNRDCAALASNGEICCNQDIECQDICTQECQLRSTTCDIGLTEYYDEYIDELYQVLADIKYENLNKILVIEPDSLPNIPTNTGFYGCSDITVDSYITGIQYTVNKLAKVPNNYIYLDIGHEGWLGWCNNLFDNEHNFISFVLNKLNDQIPYIRGFATNVANYQNLGIACDYPFKSFDEIDDFCSYYNQYLVGYCKASDNECCYDPCNLLAEYNPANNELNYIQLFRHAIEYAIYKNLISKFKTDSGYPQFIVDTSRNGKKNSYLEVNGKSECSTWCNIKGGRIGEYPTTDTALPYIDAYFWLKTPGEADGCIDFEKQGRCIESDYTCKRYDANCGTHVDNIGYLSTEPCPPEAGNWFDYQFIRLNL